MTGTHYPRLREIGVGGFGTVFQSVDGNNIPVAVKHIPATKVESESKRLVREIDILNQLSARDHPCVLRIDDAFLTVPNDDATHQLFNVNLVMPLYSSDLHKYARNVDALYTRAAGGDHAAQRQLLDMSAHAPYLAFRATAGMDFVHKCGLVHRDMKPDNVMTALAPNPRNTLAVIGDFGLARAATATETFYTCTRQYRPPEVITNTAKGNSSMDVWSLGCTFFEMATGHSLFRVPSARDARGAWVPALASGQLEALLDVFGRPDPATIERVPATNVKSYLMKTRDRPCRVPDLVRQNFKLLPPGAPGREELVELWVDLIMSCLHWLPEERPTCKQLLQHELFRRHQCFVVYSDADRVAVLQRQPDALVVLEPAPISYKGGATKETKEGNKEKIRLLVQHVNSSRNAPVQQQATAGGSQQAAGEDLEFPIPTTPRVRSAFADFAALMTDPMGAYARAATALGSELTAAERTELDAVHRFCLRLAASAAEDAAQ